ncbi:MAG: DUF4124 domain-containing protein [Desulfovibrionaceae bacterium]|nr:DUF4124 domain-containing protein [Desulfovibrionaceae bacterium]
MKKISSVLIVGFVLAASSAAFAQYSWIDKDGRRMFSDRPPPADIPEKNVLSQPRGSNAKVVHSQPAPDAAASSPAPAASQPAGVDKSLEEKKKQAEAEEAAKQKAEQQRQAAARAENCKRAMDAKATLDSGMRIRRMNDKGENEVMDDEQRAAESSRLQKVIASDCK